MNDAIIHNYHAELTVNNFETSSMNIMLISDCGIVRLMSDFEDVCRLNELYISLVNEDDLVLSILLQFMRFHSTLTIHSNQCI